MQTASEPTGENILDLLTKGLKTKITNAPATSAMNTSRIIIKNCEGKKKKLYYILFTWYVGEQEISK